MKHFTKFAAAGIVAMAGLAPMSAEALGLTFDGPTPVNGTSFPLVNTSNAGNKNAGPFNMIRDDTTESFIAWCFELTQSLNQTSNETTYNIGNGSNGIGSPALGRVGKVFDANYGINYLETDFGDRTKGAAFQLAIWEAIYETNDATLSLGSGAFQSSTTSDTTSSGPASIRTLADDYLSAANAYTGGQKYVITEFVSDDKQDVGTINAIPLPAAAWLLLGVSGALVAGKRRAAKRKTA